MKYDLIVAGCGFSGAVIAHLAAKRGDRVLLVEKRGHIAGNMYDYVDEAGILSRSTDRIPCIRTMRACARFCPACGSGSRLSCVHAR